MKNILGQIMERLTKFSLGKLLGRPIVGSLGKLLGRPTVGSLVEHRESGTWAFVHTIANDPYHIGDKPPQMLYVSGVMVDNETGKPVNEFADYWAFSDVTTVADKNVAKALKAMIYEVNEVNTDD